jgi:hypothetical protein
MVHPYLRKQAGMNKEKKRETKKKRRNKREEQTPTYTMHHIVQRNTAAGAGQKRDSSHT